MRVSLVRTGSVPAHKSVLPSSPKVSLSRRVSISADQISLHSRRISLHFHSSRFRSIHRALSESDAIPSRCQSFSVYRKLNRTGTRSFPASIPDEEYLSGSEWHAASDRTLIRKPNYAGLWPGGEIPLEELGFSGGVGNGSDHGIATITGGNDGDRNKIGAYYEEMLKSNPINAVLLGNYGRFLHEVEKDAVRAEEYCGRALLANPGDGETLSLYGKLIWETQRDANRAMSYFNQAIHAAPDDSMVLGSYANFMWEAEDKEGEEKEEENRKAEVMAVELIAAF